MRNGREMVMMVGIVLLMSTQLFMPSSAQVECWQKIQTCLLNAETEDEFKEECCTIIIQEINTERECFCSIKPTVDRNFTTATTVSNILSLCDGIATFDTICPDSTPSPIAPPPSSTPADDLEPSEFEDAVCWDDIINCIDNNSNRSELEPSLNPSSPTFNVTQFLCCPLMQQTARIEKQCFCTINTFIQENPELGPNITLVLSACNIASSTVSLNNFCQASRDPPTQALSLSDGEASSPNPAPAIRPSRGSMESLSEASLATTVKTLGKTGAEKVAANKITMIGSLSELFIFTYILIH